MSSLKSLTSSSVWLLNCSTALTILAVRSSCALINIFNLLFSCTSSSYWPFYSRYKFSKYFWSLSSIFLRLSTSFDLDCLYWVMLLMYLVIGLRHKSSSKLRLGTLVLSSVNTDLAPFYPRTSYPASIKSLIMWLNWLFNFIRSSVPLSGHPILQFTREFLALLTLDFLLGFFNSLLLLHDAFIASAC